MIQAFEKRMRWLKLLWLSSVPAISWRRGLDAKAVLDKFQADGSVDFVEANKEEK